MEAVMNILKGEGQLTAQKLRRPLGLGRDYSGLNHHRRKDLYHINIGRGFMVAMVAMEAVMNVLKREGQITAQKLRWPLGLGRGRLELNHRQRQDLHHLKVLILTAQKMGSIDAKGN